MLFHEYTAVLQRTYEKKIIVLVRTALQCIILIIIKMIYCVSQCVDAKPIRKVNKNFAESPSSATVLNSGQPSCHAASTLFNNTRIWRFACWPNLLSSLCFPFFHPQLNRRSRFRRPLNVGEHDIEWLTPWGVRIVRFSSPFCLFRGSPTVQSSQKVVVIICMYGKIATCELYTVKGGPHSQAAQEGCIKWMRFFWAHREKTAFSVMKRCAPRVALSCIKYVVHSSSLPFS